ncbi:Tudor-knot domain-containing protein [Propionivibrio sp.]|uniref:Tudor-knot domain-containing protein n=1 Tax=Propionivibrio sp. TaxID=2212460 RepID=UPI0025E34A1E|nr:Tudor-knot domain-containing protein [Propionivibrio sp.]MBK7356620.1 hypothetical protein [Propionivibrio sp.]MBK8744201.1 hypothetical protein [Propionivibrio sp.]MBK8894318.1 hypothetical protein [Propionivibrio sp.]MBL0208878.1 hypothetical protein [Propionivibrio sp.]
MGVFNKLRVVLVCLILGPMSQAIAQIPTYNVFNDTNVVLNFQTLDPARGTWKDQKLNAHSQITLNMYSGNPTGKIRIATPNHGYNEYQVGAGGIYRLTWSDQKQMWDVRATQQANAITAAKPMERSNPASPGQGALPYRLGDSTLVSWKGKWYNATVIQTGSNKVKIHYDGYDSNWDEWVDGTRIRYR